MHPGIIKQADIARSTSLFRIHFLNGDAQRAYQSLLHCNILDALPAGTKAHPNSLGRQ